MELRRESPGRRGALQHYPHVSEFLDGNDRNRTELRQNESVAHARRASNAGAQGMDHDGYAPKSGRSKKWMECELHPDYGRGRRSDAQCSRRHFVQTGTAMAVLGNADLDSRNQLA